MEKHGSEESCERLAATVQAKMKTSPEYSSKYCCIYRVPPLLRRNNELAYTPAIVSVGPLHHNDKRLLPMEPYKLSCLQSFLHHSSPNMELASYLMIIKGLEAVIRRCYEDPIHLSSDDFIQMVLIDSVFLIELFRNCSDPYLKDDGCICRSLVRRNVVRRDIQLEENQLPFFILVHLYRVAFRSDENLDQVPPFTDLACKFLRLNKSKMNVDAITKEATWCCHLLDLLRSHYKPFDLRINHENDHDHDHVSVDTNSPMCPTITSLFAAGVRFKVTSSEGYSSNLLNIYFDKEKGILNIPKLGVEDQTEALFRNLLAFEQCHYLPDNTYFTNYHFFLNWLIHTPEDVRLLAKAGIIENWLGSNRQVSDLINSLGHDTLVYPEYYNYMDITQQLISHCNRRWNRYRATLEQTYFKHPWAAMSVMYAIILLVLTMMQIVAGILAIPHVLKGT